jgi:transmembrane sensor
MPTPEEQIDKSFADHHLQNKADEETLQLMYQHIQLRKQNGKIVALAWRRVAVAAAVVIMVGAGGYWLLTQQKPKNALTQVEKKDIAAPVSTNAVITLFNGQRIILDSVSNGSIVRQGNIGIVKLADGEIAYQPGKNTVSENIFNTLVNPRGSRVVTITLADGTKVWLNAETSLRYPIAFGADERKVSVTGEAYFEVAHDDKKKFIVESNAMQTEVLGTHFNVNAYEDPVVTLLEGSVIVRSGKSLDLSDVKLIPGEAASLNSITHNLKKSSADVESAIAWKNGMFSLKSADIKAVMNQVARWYNVDVEYKGEIKERFYVEMNRNTNVSNVFKILEGTGGVHFVIEGRKIIVMP